ncbi:hypothetical protein BCR44DRAFT_1218789 [Catenaria anguillulae PL171]|uniref:Uncharacterized protein n=1 Tax=Catenaria anguillulae PL171 TaxID=765915 RepID=A0A1Y2I1Y7_9FUNG|nr:hypothetical protein BCR44DRAFT_1218789 [Catenaria anguillulae PL171]
MKGTQMKLTGPRLMSCTPPIFKTPSTTQSMTGPNMISLSQFDVMGSIWSKIILNLPPEDRIQFENTPIVAFIPGPNKPKPSCFQQCMEEIADMLQRLEAGFPVTVNGERVRCRVFVIHGGGDYPALNSLTNMRGVNAWFPCVYCYIPGIRQARDGFNTFYPAHTQPYELAPNGNRAASNPPVQERPVLWGKWQDGPEVDCFPPNLHKRTDEWYNFHIGEIALLAGNRQGQEDIGKACGLNGPAAFDTLLLCKNPSTYAVVDPFHLICENVIPNLCKIFCGTLKPMGPAEHVGAMPFLFTKDDIKFINMCLALNGKYIPPPFGRCPKELGGQWKGSEWLLFGMLYALPLYFHAWGPDENKLIFAQMLMHSSLPSFNNWRRTFMDTRALDSTSCV